MKIAFIIRVKENLSINQTDCQSKTYYNAEQVEMHGGWVSGEGQQLSRSFG